jgi:hypothetical protein
MRASVEASKAYAREYQKRDYVKAKARIRNSAIRSKDRNGHLDRVMCWKFGLRPGEYAKMLALQGGLCAICHLIPDEVQNTAGRRLAVDHCHQSGRIRGLLCDRCNRGIGQLHENPEILRRAAGYLEEQHILAVLGEE